jgi:hypothetical protein
MFRLTIQVSQGQKTRVPGTTMVMKNSPTIFLYCRENAVKHDFEGDIVLPRITVQAGGHDNDHVHGWDDQYSLSSPADCGRPWDAFTATFFFIELS